MNSLKDLTLQEAIDAVESWGPDQNPLDRGYDPYNSADTHWWTWLNALARGRL